MKQFWTLYWNELKSNKIIFFFLIIATYSMVGYISPLVLDHSRVSQTFIDYRHIEELSYSILFFIPLIFYYLITDEKRGNTKYQLFSLPIKRMWMVTPRFMLILSYVIIIPFVLLLLSAIYTAYEQLFLDKYPWILKQVVSHFGQFTPNYLRQYSVGFTNYYLPFFVLVAGLLSCVVSFNTIFKKYRFSLGVLLMILLIVLFVLSGRIVSMLFRSYYGIGKYDYIVKSYEQSMQYLQHIQEFYRLQWLLIRGYMVTVGLFFLGLSMFLYEKYAEV